MQKLGQLIDKLCNYLLLGIVFSMIGMSLFSIIARMFSITSMWIDPLLRHFVFLSAFLGGVLAIGADKHIKIDVLSKFIEYRFKGDHAKEAIYQMFTLIITLGIIYFLGRAGWDFYQTEVEYGQEAFLGLHSSTMTFIIPGGFLLIFLRGVLRFLELFNLLFKNKEAQS